MVKRKSPQLRCPTCTPKVYPETELRAALIIRLVLGRRVKADLGGKIGNNPTIRVAWQRWLKFRVHLKARARKGLEWGGGVHTCRMCPRNAVLVTGMGGKSSGSWLLTAVVGGGHPRGCGARACCGARVRVRGSWAAEGKGTRPGGGAQVLLIHKEQPPAPPTDAAPAAITRRSRGSSTPRHAAARAG